MSLLLLNVPLAFSLSFLNHSLSSRPEMAWIHAAGDLLAAFSYYLIVVALNYFLRKRRDLRFRWGFELFGIFLFFAGTIHVLSIWAPWHRVYLLEGIVKLASSLLAISAALLLWKLVPKALSLPNPIDVKESLARLQSEVSDHQRSEAQLTQARLESEKVAAESTQKLFEVNQALEAERKARHEAEEAIRENEAHFRSLVEHALDITLLLTPQCEIQYESPSFRQVLGYARNELTGRNIFDWIHPDDRGIVEAILTLEGKLSTKHEPAEFRMLHHDGSWRVFETVVSNRFKDGGATEIIVNGRDVTELRKTENEMRLLPFLMQEIGETGDFHTALEIALRKVCEATGWHYGEAWIPRRDGNVLEAGPAWYGNERFKVFREVSRELRFPPGMELPGRIWASGKPERIEDVSSQTDPSFFRLQLAREAGIQAGFGVPVASDDKILAVLVFFTAAPHRVDKRLLNLVTAIASHIGSVIRRKRAEEALREAYEKLEDKIQERTEELARSNEALQNEIAEWKIAEESLRRSRENYLTLVNSIDGIVWEYDLETAKFTFVSTQAEKILGYPRNTWFVEPSFWQDHIHGGDRDAVIAFRAKVAHEKKDDQFEYRMISADGRTLWLRDMVTVVVEGEQTVKLRGVMVDITEQKQVEEALNQERNFASAVLDTAGAVVMILDVDGRIVRFNRVCEQISGYSIDEVKEKCFWDLFVVPEEVGKVKAIFTRLLAGQFPTNYESYWVAKNGSRCVIAWTSTILFRSDGSVAHVIATGIDITKRKEAEQKLTQAVADWARSNKELDRSTKELKEANDRLKKLDEMKSHFISAASHELKTPLTSLKGYVEMILQGEVGAVNAKQREFLGYVKDSTDRLHRLLSELLDISKIEAGQAIMDPSAIDTRELLRQELMIFKAQADEKKLSLAFETDDDLNPIYGDADKIREAMGNLISNAIKYTPRRGKIKVYARNKGEGIQIDVQDTGIGIKLEDQMRIFEPFQHIDKGGAVEEDSTGLGLALVKKIIEAHGGSVGVKSEAGKGSTFSVSLPKGSGSYEESKTSWAGVSG